jgi:multidrug efflux pump subunit AcrB
MKKIIDYFVENSVVVNLLTILIVIMGMFSVFSLNKEVFPNVDFNYVIVRGPFPGTAPEDVEKLLSIDLERALKSVEGIEEINTLSAEGGVIVSIKVDPEYTGEEVSLDVKEAIDQMDELPEDAEDLIVFTATNKNRGLMNIAVFGDNEWELRNKAKYLRDKLEVDKRVSEVSLQGYRDESIDIQVKKEALDQYDMSLSEIVTAIRDRQTNISAGNLKAPLKEKLIRTLVENESLEEIGNIIIRSNDIGGGIKVKDVAQVSRILKDKTREDRANKELAIFLDIKVKNSADVLQSAAFIKNVIEVESKKIGVRYKIYDDSSFRVERRLGVLTSNAISGIILVTICLLLFMNLRVSIITALGAPFAFLVAFSLMDSFDITINLISMFGLIMVLGMLVDDSIIVAEQYYQNLEKGLDPKAAAKKAAYDTLAPVTATVLTTMVAFGSLFYMEGIMGKFLWPVPAVVIIALAASWIECFIILPGHLADFAAKIKKEDIEKDRWYKPLQIFYQGVLEKCLKHTKTTILFFVLLFIGSLITAKNMRFELFPSDDVTKITVNVKAEVGTPFEVTRSELLKVEDSVYKTLTEQELVGVRTTSGYQQFKGGRSKSGSHYGNVSIELTMNNERERKTKEIVQALSQAVKKVISPKYQYTVDARKNGPPQGKAANVEIYGDDLQELLAAAQSVKTKMAKLEGVISTELDYEIGKTQIIVRIIPKEARRLGVSNKQIALELRRAFEGEVATTVKKSDEDIDILVRFDKESRGDQATIKNIRVLNSQGRRIKLSSIATFEEVQGAYLIRRLNRKRVMSVSSDIDLKKTTSIAINKKLKPLMDEHLKDYQGLSYELAGENKDTKESLKSFRKALLASMFIIFIMLVVQFSSMVQPFIIMTAIPFGFIGVVIAFVILGLPIGFMALMGMLGLVGVVINDSIVLVTFINRTLIEEEYNVNSIVKATVTRFRPVILTTVTTVAGLLPVAHATGGDPFLKPMATSFAYGLLFSSLITLIFVPACYKFYIDILSWKERKKSKKFSSSQIG